MLKNKSLCNKPRKIPVDWVDYVDYQNHEVKRLFVYLDELPLIRRLNILQRMTELKERASFGAIPKESREFENISLYPELFELKWSIDDEIRRRVEIRQYHAEPGLTQPILLALHMHIKNTKGGRLAVKNSQNQEISFAKMRLESGRKRNWMI